MKRWHTTMLSVLMTFASFAQGTYKVGPTEYYYNQYYTTTGQPMVKRSEAIKASFLRERGYASVPEGYQVDHIIPLSEGGSDSPSNMQLLTIDEHKRKTATERARHANSTYYSTPNYLRSSTATPTYSSPKSSNSTYYSAPPAYNGGRTIQTGSRGGNYYINSNGNKTYIKKK